MIGLAIVTVIAGAAVTAGVGDEQNDSTGDTTNETAFDWGTVTTERHPGTDALAVNVTVDSVEGASVSAISAPKASERVREAEGDADYDSFEWGVVRHEANSDTGAVDVTVIVDADSDVSLSVQTVGENGSQSSSTMVISAGGESGQDGSNGADGSTGAAGEADEPGEDGESGTATTNITIGQSTGSGAALSEAVGLIDVDDVSIDIGDDDGDEDE